MIFWKFWKILKLAGIFECESILGNMRFTIKFYCSMLSVFIYFITCHKFLQSMKSNILKCSLALIIVRSWCLVCCLWTVITVKVRPFLNVNEVPVYHVQLFPPDIVDFSNTILSSRSPVSLNSSVFVIVIILEAKLNGMLHMGVSIFRENVRYYVVICWYMN